MNDTAILKKIIQHPIYFFASICLLVAAPFFMNPKKGLSVFFGGSLTSSSVWLATAKMPSWKMFFLTNLWMPFAVFFGLVLIACFGIGFVCVVGFCMSRSLEKYE